VRPQPPQRSRRSPHLLAVASSLLLVLGMLPIAAAPVSGVSADLVISEVYGGGGNSGAPLTNDYVELYNRGSASVSLSGMSVQYASATGTGAFGANSGQLTELPDTTLAAGSYLLVEEGSGGANGSALPTPDVTDATPINMSASSGKVALVTGTTSLGCNGGSTGCDSTALARIIDLVGYGSANFFEGSAAAPGLSSATAAIRAGGGATDTDDNAADFTAGAPDPDSSGGGGGTGTPPSADCGDPATAIHDVQGSGDTSPIAGDDVAVEGVVVGDYQASTSFNGFYLQAEDADADADPATSEGVFVFEGGSSVDVAAGDVVRVVGTVSEFSGLTEIGSVTSVVVCDTGASVTPATVTLPFPSVSYPERWEGMLVDIPQTLTVSEVFTLARFGEVVLSSGGRLTQPTEIAMPGTAANDVQAGNDRNRIVLDDGDNRQNIDPTLYPQGGLSASNTLRVGDTLAGGTFVMDDRFGAFRLQPTGTVAFSHDDPRPAAPAPVGGSLRVASFNVLNFFNGDGLGGGFPTARGAETPFELDRQQAKIVSAITGLDADIVGLMEIENDAGPNSALADLVAALNAATAPGTFAYVDTGVIGGDEIKVALIYRTAAATPVGPYAVLTSAVDPRFVDTLNRPALAQTFDAAGGGRLTVVVNHLKSKGSDCNAAGDPDTGDGQGNCNLTRTNAAHALVDWLATDPTGSGDRDALLIGDYNSYAMEDPISAFRDAGFVDLTKALGGPGTYSYVFDAQSGTLDHALASPTLAAQVTGATEWHINADEPIGLDYNVNFKTDNQVDTFYAPDAYRSSDHDPVIVGLDLGAFDFGGFGPPLASPLGTTRAKAGSTVPVRFSLGGDRGLEVFASTPRVFSCADWPAGPSVAADTAGHSMLSYDPATDSYTFAWKTSRAWAGSCRTIEVTFTDGSYATASVDLVR
jgi:uncharacterized protein